MHICEPCSKGIKLKFSFTFYRNMKYSYFTLNQPSISEKEKCFLLKAEFLYLNFRKIIKMKQKCKCFSLASIGNQMHLFLLWDFCFRLQNNRLKWSTTSSFPIQLNILKALGDSKPVLENFPWKNGNLNAVVPRSANYL